MIQSLLDYKRIWINSSLLKKNTKANHKEQMREKKVKVMQGDLWRTWFLVLQLRNQLVSHLGENEEQQEVLVLKQSLDTSQKGHELCSTCRAEEGVAEGRGLGDTHSHHESHPEQVYCPLLGGGTKHLTRNSTSPAHKYTTVKKGEASSLLLSFCLFSVSHNINQTARLPRPPNKSAVLLSLAAAAQGELWDGVPTLGAAPQAAVPPHPASQGPWTGDSPQNQRSGSCTTNTAAGSGSQPGSPSPTNPPASYCTAKICKPPNHQALLELWVDI